MKSWHKWQYKSFLLGSYHADFWKRKWHFPENWSVLLYLFISYLEHNFLWKQWKHVSMYVIAKRWIGIVALKIHKSSSLVELIDHALNWPNLHSKQSQNITFDQKCLYLPLILLMFSFFFSTLFVSQKQQPCATKCTRTLFFLSVGKCCRFDTQDQSCYQRLFGRLC